jgi:hypothetical protein
MQVTPLTIKQANELISRLHRHHKPVVGHRFSIGLLNQGVLVGAAVVGRPVAREVEQYTIAEVTRLVTDGTPNACSMLYSACARAAKAMGFTKIQTYILDSEPGTSLKASGWKLEGKTAGGNWNHSWRKGRREDQPMEPKSRWGLVLNSVEEVQCQPPSASPVTTTTITENLTSLCQENTMVSPS